MQQQTISQKPIPAWRVNVIRRAPMWMIKPAMAEAIMSVEPIPERRELMGKSQTRRWELARKAASGYDSGQAMAKLLEGVEDHFMQDALSRRIRASQDAVDLFVSGKITSLISQSILARRVSSAGHAKIVLKSRNVSTDYDSTQLDPVDMANTLFNPSNCRCPQFELVRSIRTADDAKEVLESKQVHCRKALDRLLDLIYPKPG